MSWIPSLKTHPVMVPVIAVIVIFIVIGAIFAAGYATCRLSAAKNNLNIVVDDVKVGKVNDDEKQIELNENYARAEVLREFQENEEDGGCLTDPAATAKWGPILRPGWFDESGFGD